jgi:hypothetical protein
MIENLPTQRSQQQLDKFLQQMSTVRRRRLIFALDATASRQPTWDRAAKLQTEMFDAAAATLEVQLVFYRGINECQYLGWTANARKLADKMSQITCKAGETQLGRILEHVHKEHKQRPVNAVVFVGDAMEEEPNTLYDRAAELGTPLLVFQEGNDAKVEEVFRELVRLTEGAYCRFDAGSADQLRDLLRAAAKFATGGRAALATSKSAAAVSLLKQLK